MRQPGRGGRGCALLLAGIVGLAAAFPIFVSGHMAAKVPYASMELLRSSGSDEGSAGPVECGKGQRDGDLKKLELTARRGDAIEFKCAASEVLNPSHQHEGRFDKVFAYAAGSCQTGKELPLEQQVTGATLTQKPKGKDPLDETAPVFAFQYSSEPDNEKHLCYTCNTTAAAQDLSVSGQSTVSCTVHITVPGKDGSTTTPSTPATSRTGPRAVTTAVASAMGGFLAITLLS